MTLGEVSFLTNDVRRLANFYKALLSIDNGSDDEVHQFLITEGVTLTVYNDGSRKPGDNRNLCLAFTVDDVDAEYARLQAMNATIVDPPQTRPWGARNLCFLDPDGNQIYLRSLPS